MEEIVVNDGFRSFAKTCNNVPFPRARRPKTCGLASFLPSNFLEPAVDELNALWKRVEVNTFKCPSTAVEIQAAMLCFASDIPAARKLCGFLGHSAKQGCCHCKKEFPGGFGEQKNYGGFNDRDEWPKRSSEQHRRDTYRVKNCRSENAAEKLASQLGVKYTVLFELPYYTSIEMCVIDPMHNLFLGQRRGSFLNGLKTT